MGSYNEAPGKLQSLRVLDATMPQWRVTLNNFSINNLYFQTNQAITYVMVAKPDNYIQYMFHNTSSTPHLLLLHIAGFNRHDGFFGQNGKYVAIIPDLFSTFLDAFCSGHISIYLYKSPIGNAHYICFPGLL